MNMNMNVKSNAGNEAGSSSVQRKLWWILPLIVLVVLVAVIYVLSRLSAADSEMYPTTMLGQQNAIVRVC